MLRVENLSVPGFARNVSFSSRAGETLGLYGLVGAGRSETAEAIFGLRTKTSGDIFVDGREVRMRSAKDSLRLGLGLVPEDRKKQGLVLTMGSRQNTGLALLRQINRFGFVANEREETIYQNYRKKLDIRSVTSSAKVGTLSGGNLQKIVLAKWLATKPKLLILDEPTRGIDVGAKTEVHSLISDLAEQGLAVLLISSEMPEIMGLSHRILTMQPGIVTGEFDAESVTEEELVVAIMHRSTIEAGVVTEPERICVLEMDSDEQERVPGAVLSLIEHRRYEPGDRLPSECELAERFSVGRRALREALAKLENMRLIERRKNSGVFLTRSPHMTSLETLVLYSDLGLPQDKRVNAECVKVRRIIEVQAIRLACERRSEEDITKLKQTNSAFSETSAGPLITSALDYEFHIDIFRATQNAVLLRLVTPFYMISRTRRELFSAEPARCRASHKQHVGMVRAIQERDADRAEALMVKHIGRVERYFDSVPG